MQPAAETLRQVVALTLSRLGETHADVSLLITGDERVRRLNSAYRGIDRSTDVLSFPDGDELPDGRRFLGEVVVSLDTARVQADRLGHGELRELEELVLHGVLHLLGHDHENDDGEMNRLELELREELLR
ncbi:MAG: rRNA maturation RNase YbeY [Acidobacteria bacterium]|jgi:probable rRNA maturation factor|nr:rRNA maturation RNase YbeY [Acidobacteriota bacterium]